MTHCMLVGGVNTAAGSDDPTFQTPSRDTAASATASTWIIHNFYLCRMLSMPNQLKRSSA